VMLMGVLYSGICGGYIAKVPAPRCEMRNFTSHTPRDWSPPISRDLPIRHPLPHVRTASPTAPAPSSATAPIPPAPPNLLPFFQSCLRGRDETCPVSTGEGRNMSSEYGRGTRLVQLVREGGGVSRAKPAPPRGPPPAAASRSLPRRCRRAMRRGQMAPARRRRQATWQRASPLTPLRARCEGGSRGGPGGRRVRLVRGKGRDVSAQYGGRNAACPFSTGGGGGSPVT